jgi:hypothetical protein
LGKGTASDKLRVNPEALVHLLKLTHNVSTPRANATIIVIVASTK